MMSLLRSRNNLFKEFKYNNKKVRIAQYAMGNGLEDGYELYNKDVHNKDIYEIWKKWYVIKNEYVPYNIYIPYIFINNIKTYIKPYDYIMIDNTSKTVLSKDEYESL